MLDLDERTVQGVVDGLTRKQLLLEKSGFGSRVPKYQHLFCNTQFGSLKFSPQETAIVCELLVRGPQTPGELRSRAARLAPFHDVRKSRRRSRRWPAARRARASCGCRASRDGANRDIAICSVATSRSRPKLHAADSVTSVPSRADAGADASILARLEALEAAVESLQRQLRSSSAADQ